MRTDPHPWDGWAPWAVAALTLGLGLSIWAWFPPGIWHDDGVYVLLGRALADGEGFRYSGVPGAFLATKFPPLFPLALALIWSVAPELPENAVLLSAANLVFLAVGSGTFVLYSRRIFRLPLPWVLGAAALVWLSPALWRVAMVPLSEPLFILLFLLALWAGGRLEQGGGWGSMAVFLLLAMAAFHTRTIGVVLIPGISGALALRGRRRDGTLVFLLGAILALPWILWSRWASSRIPEPLLDTLGPYGSWLAGEILRGPGHYLSFLPGNALHLAGRCVSLLLPGVAPPFLWIGLLLLPVLFLGLWTMGKRSLTAPLTVGGYALVLLLWPFQDVRLMVPLLPLLALGTGTGFRTLLCSGALPLGTRIPAVTVGMGWVVVFLAGSIVRLATGWPGEVYQVRSEALVRAVQTVQEKTPPDAVVGAPELWSGIHLFSGRRVSPSARFLPLSQTGPAWGTPEQQYRLWMEAGLTHILVEHGGEVHGEALDRLDALCPPGSVQLLDVKPGQFLVKLNWDQECRDLLMPTE